MYQKQKTYKNWSAKCLLMVAYIFLVFLQCSSRFYSIANFYIVPSHLTLKLGNHETLAPAKKMGFEQNLHLKLNKRFKDESHPIDFINNHPSSFTVDYFYIAAKKKFYSFNCIYRGAYFHAPCLRGPPCA
jgi:hypothetical protein